MSTFTKSNIKIVKSLDTVNDLKIYENQFNQNATTTSVYKPKLVSIHPFTTDQINRIISSGSNYSITINGVTYKGSQITLNLISTFKEFQYNQFNIIFGPISQSKYNRLSVVGVQFIYTSDNGDQIEIKNKADLGSI